MRTRLLLIATAALLAAAPSVTRAQATRASGATAAVPRDDARTTRLKREATARVDSLAGLTQEMVDMVFSFGELGFQEVETARYLTDVLERNGFTITRGYAGMPTAWVARWGSGKPVIAIGSDVDGIPKASQKPGVAYREPLLEGAPGHGEGHNSGQAVNITAALALKAIMERDRLPGTLVLWPGVAEELVAGKAFLVREGLFRDADVALFTHVSSNLSTAWGGASGNGLVSVEYTFQGTSAHSAGSPWRGRSALDAVEIMNVAWQYRREHMRIQQRSHHVITNGGDQPNVVPQVASVWYYFRETDEARIREMWAIGDTIARAAAMATGTTLASSRVLGSAWPQHFNKPIAQALQANIERAGLPRWSDADQTLAKALQCEMGVTQRGLASEVGKLEEPLSDALKRGGGSDDIGDVTWTLPTVTLRYPSNIPGLPGHNWTDAIAMATPIAHKGATAGARALAMTLVDLLTRPALIAQAWDYFRNEQTKDLKYTPFIRPADVPAIELNAEIMARYRPEMRKQYYDPSRHASYLEQLGIAYPTVRPCGPTT